MPTPLTRNINVALSEEDYAAIETRTQGCTPTETVRDLLRTVLHGDPNLVTLLAELLFIRRVLLNGPEHHKAIDETKVRDAKLLLAGKPLPYGDTK